MLTFIGAILFIIGTLVLSVYLILLRTWKEAVVSKLEMQDNSFAGKLVRTVFGVKLSSISYEDVGSEDIPHLHIEDRAKVIFILNCLLGVGTFLVAVSLLFLFLGIDK